MRPANIGHLESLVASRNSSLLYYSHTILSKPYVCASEQHRYIIWVYLDDSNLGLDLLMMLLLCAADLVSSSFSSVYPLDHRMISVWLKCIPNKREVQAK